MDWGDYDPCGDLCEGWSDSEVEEPSAKRELHDYRNDAVVTSTRCDLRGSWCDSEVEVSSAKRELHITETMPLDLQE